MGQAVGGQETVFPSNASCEMKGEAHGQSVTPREVGVGHHGRRTQPAKRGRMDLHKEFLEFTRQALCSDCLDRDPDAPDLYSILAPLADQEDLYDFMGRIPDDQIGEVLGWAMGTELD
jgi:hypothetical protein